jgi:hypothetical protein
VLLRRSREKSPGGHLSTPIRLAGSQTGEGMCANSMELGFHRER